MEQHGTTMDGYVPPGNHWTLGDLRAVYGDVKIIEGTEPHREQWETLNSIGAVVRNGPVTDLGWFIVGEHGCALYLDENVTLEDAEKETARIAQSR